MSEKEECEILIGNDWSNWKVVWLIGMQFWKRYNQPISIQNLKNKRKIEIFCWIKVARIKDVPLSVQRLRVFTAYSAFKRVVQIQSKRGRMKGRKRRENFVVSNDFWGILFQIPDLSIYWLVLVGKAEKHPDSQWSSAKTIDSWNVALKPANFSISWTKWEDQMAALPNTSMEADAIQRVQYSSFSSSSWIHFL